MTLTEAISNLKLLEGGIGTEPDGQAVNEGIDQSSWDLYCLGKGIPTQSVDTLTPEQIAAFYGESYWFPLRCDMLPDPIPFALFQYELNTSGAGAKGRAVRDLQLVLGVAPDGIMGPLTVEAARNNPDPKKVTLLLLDRQDAWYEELWKANPEDPIKGWENRVATTKQILGL